MTLRKGSTGATVKQLQQFLKISADGDFGPGTENAVKVWQQKNGLTVDGIVGKNTLARMGIKLEEPESEFDETYKGVTINGSHFPGKKIYQSMKVTLSDEMENEYLPALQRAMGDRPRGFQLLCTVMAHKEGFRQGTRSYRTNNPGNIGNTDSGRNRGNASLEDGILLQRDYIEKIADGQHSAYPMGKQKVIKPYFSPEIAKHAKSYGMSPYLPGYKFVFNGQLDQYVKIYSTGARGGNGYLSMIISYFNKHGLQIDETSKIQDIIKMA